MYGIGPLYATIGNVTKVYSPVTMCNDWPALGRLMFMVFCSCLGTTVNGFFVASFFVERRLRKVGNVYLACVGMADMIVTSVVMPVAAVVLLSGEWDILPVCHALQFLTESSTYCYSMFFTLVSIETYFRLCRSTEEYKMFVSIKVGAVSTLAFIICFAAAATGVYLGLDYDYCQRRHYGDFYFRSATSIIFHAIPFLVTFCGLITASVRVRRRARTYIHYKRSQQYTRDFSTTNLNITAFVFYVIAWTPYLIVVHETPDTTDTTFYHCVWIGMSRSVVNGFLYSCLNRNFRRAFSHLFYYCCCKSTGNNTYNNRHRRAGIEYKAATGDVRVHIMHQALNTGAAQRAASSSQETHAL